MALKTITVNLNEIEKHKYKRFDFGYYYIQQMFVQLSNKFMVDTIKNLKEYVISGNYINRYFNKSSKTIPYIRVATVKHYFLNENDSDFVYVSENTPVKIKTAEKDIVIGRTAVLGIASFIDTYSDGFAVSQHITKLRLKENVISPEFVLGYLNSPLFENQMVIASFGTSRLELTHSQLENVKIILPDKKFERKIKDKIKKSVSLHRKSLLLLQKAQQLFYQKLNIDFSKIEKEKYYSVKLSDFAKDDIWTPAFSYPLYVNTLKAIQKKWQTVLLGKIVTAKKGDEVGSANYNKYLNKKDTDIPFIRTSDLVNYEVDQFPDFYVPEEIYQELKQDIKDRDVLFAKDGKIGMSAMITKNDKAIIASGIVKLRLKTEAKKYNLTPEYLFIVLSLKETGLYPAIRRTIIASTIPHLREERIKELEISILDKNSIDEITKLVKKAFELKDKKKRLVREAREEIDNYFDIH